jgi:hypothetical protein
MSTDGFRTTLWVALFSKPSLHLLQGNGFFGSTLSEYRQIMQVFHQFLVPSEFRYLKGFHTFISLSPISSRSPFLTPIHKASCFGVCFVEYPDRAHSQFPRRYEVRTKPLPVPRFPKGFMQQLELDVIQHDHLLPCREVIKVPFRGRCRLNAICHIHNINRRNWPNGARDKLHPDSRAGTVLFCSCPRARGEAKWSRDPRERGQLH